MAHRALSFHYGVVEIQAIFCKFEIHACSQAGGASQYLLAGWGHKGVISRCEVIPSASSSLARGHPHVRGHPQHEVNPMREVISTCEGIPSVEIIMLN